MADKTTWAAKLSEMEDLTGTVLAEELLAFPVEATAESALTYGVHVCIGTLKIGSYAGFTHEGLHLLLQEKWASSPEIESLMARSSFADPFLGRLALDLLQTPS